MLLREGLSRVLDEAGFVTAGAFGDADALLAAATEVPYDVAILDVRMPPTFRDEGVRAALELHGRHPDRGVLLLSQYVETTYARELLGAGAGGMGYLLKDRVASLDELVDAVTRVAAGGTALDPEVVAQLVGRHADPLSSLTPRERETLQLMAEGRTNQAIAARLHVGVGAIEKNVSAIFTKLDLEDSGADHRRVLAVLAWLDAAI
ncbi:response regulator [Humibacter ginsenosidimutans]|uniref:Response regulator transcription factor n=1 Tax=Humibacter ginsenosidimutans TaxID=2599293 RepID=A0A5B8MAQ0_9MICO|nr:response regulator transcription factor [Humibacter ginsenosidimutans]QDZ16670.1 response regulator transcription factor [Humibacter ginsenosidimutans]